MEKERNINHEIMFKVLRLDKHLLTSSNTSKWVFEAKKKAMYLMKHRENLRNSDIAFIFNKSESTVNKAYIYVKKKLETDDQFRRDMIMLERVVYGNYKPKKNTND